MKWKTLEEVQKEHIIETYIHCDLNKTLTAKTLGITVKTLYNFFNRYESEGWTDMGKVLKEMKLSHGKPILRKKKKVSKKSKEIVKEIVTADKLKEEAEQETFRKAMARLEKQEQKRIDRFKGVHPDSFQGQIQSITATAQTEDYVVGETDPFRIFPTNEERLAYRDFMLNADFITRKCSAK